MEYLKIHDWEHWQSYRSDRGQPPWIKVHRDLLRNVKWAALDDSERGQLISIWMLAADHNGVIPASPEIIQKLCLLSSLPNLNKFIELGFIDSNSRHVDANVTSERHQHDQPETETETETETEEEVAQHSIESDIINLCDEIATQINKRVFNPYSFNNKNKRKRPEARFKTLTRCKEELEKNNEDFKADPWPYLEHILTVEHQNANEADAIREHEKRKQEEQDAEGALRALVGS